MELKDYCAEQQQEVNTYGWVDQRLRVVRIPDRPGHGSGSEERLAGARRQARPGAAAVTVPPADGSAGGDDLQGPCGYLAPEHAK